MKHKTLVLAAAVVAMAAASCESAQMITVEEQQFSEARVLQVETLAQVEQIKGKLHVYMRVEWSRDYSREMVAALDNDLNALHGRAAFDVLKEYHADELVAPTWNVYTITDRDDPHYGWYRVELFGFLARFEDWNGQQGVLPCNVDIEVLKPYQDGNGNKTISIKPDGSVQYNKR